MNDQTDKGTSISFFAVILPLPTEKMEILAGNGKRVP